MLGTASARVEAQADQRRQRVLQAGADVEREVGVLLDLVVVGALGRDDRQRARAREHEGTQLAVQDLPRHDVGQHVRAPAHDELTIVVHAIAARDADTFQLEREDGGEGQRSARAEQTAVLGRREARIVGDPQLQILGEQVHAAGDAQLDLHAGEVVLGADRPAGEDNKRRGHRRENPSKSEWRPENIPHGAHIISRVPQRKKVHREARAFPAATDRDVEARTPRGSGLRIFVLPAPSEL